MRTRARRVAVKARVVKLNPQRGAARGRQFVSAKAVDAHLRYLQRDGVTKDGEKGQVYSAERDVEDGRAFVERGREDRHQFRFIVSAEDGVELSDPRATTRDLMKQMEADLGTKLDWIAVDHHNTGHPHTHIIVRGVTDDGKTLNIAGDYIAHGIRERASEIVTRELGRQTELEVTRSLEREVDADRFTRLDRMLIAEQRSRNEFADLRPDRDMLDTLPAEPGAADPAGAQAGAHGAGDRGRDRAMDRVAQGRNRLAGAWRARRHHQDHAPGVDARRLGGGPPHLGAMSCTARRRPSRSSAGCSTRGWAATRWASGCGW